MQVINEPGQKVPIKAWIDGVQLEPQARQQLINIAKLPFAFKHVAVMPDVHLGIGATIGSVMATKGAVAPPAVGVDLGCGMMAVRTILKASDLPESLTLLRAAIEKAVPHGRTDHGGANDRGAWGTIPGRVLAAALTLNDGLVDVIERAPKLARWKMDASYRQLGTLGGGNHFIEVCLDTEDNVWVMLHSGSRGVGNAIASFYIDKAKEECAKFFVDLPHPDLAFLPEKSELFHDYWQGVLWAQNFALLNREIMMEFALDALAVFTGYPTGLAIRSADKAVNCHHNYVARENHFGQNVIVTRKGAVRAREGDLGIIPGSMGAKSFIVRGKGNPQSFMSCSHGAGRMMSRAQAVKTFTIEDHAAATAGIECRKDADVLDETPGAYKPIEDVIAAQSDLIDVVAELHQVLCVKG